MLELSQDRHELVWTGGPPDAKVRVHHTQAGREMLSDFVQLWEGLPDSVLRYARKWGVLYLDKTGRPCHPNGSSVRREPIEAWKYWSRRAQAVLNIAANLKLGNLGETADWAALRGLERRTGTFLQEMDRYAPFVVTMLPRIDYPFKKDGSGLLEPRYKRSVRSEIVFLSIEATLWLKLGRLGFVVGVAGNGWGIWLDYNECMFAAIALQLALVLTEVEALYTCSGCHKPYARNKRGPKPNQQNYCEDCGRKKALERADEKRRRKMATAKRLQREGLSLPEIAKRVDTKTSTVYGWLKKRPKL